MKDIPKRRNIREARRNRRKQIATSHPSFVIKRGTDLSGRSLGED